MAAKPLSRLFGSAVAGAVKQDEAPKRTPRAGAAPGAPSERRPAGAPAGGAGKVRGRGHSMYDPTVGGAPAAPAAAPEVRGRGSSMYDPAVARHLPPAPEPGVGGPVRRARESRRATPYAAAPPEPAAAKRQQRPRGGAASAAAAWRGQPGQFDGLDSSGPAVFVRNLPQGATERQLREIFSEAGLVAAVEVDAGPMCTATVRFLRQAAAFEAERRFHGRWLLGAQLKVSAVEPDVRADGADDDEFWRRELQDMARRRRTSAEAYDPGPPRLRGEDRRQRGRGSFLAP